MRLQSTPSKKWRRGYFLETCSCSPPGEAGPGDISPSSQEGRFVLWQFLCFTSSGILMPQGQQVPGIVPHNWGNASPPCQARLLLSLVTHRCSHAQWIWRGCSRGGRGLVGKAEAFPSFCFYGDWLCALFLLQRFLETGPIGASRG